MSRFDRRLKDSSSSSTSPRPGTATCKIRNRNNNSMLSGFIKVVEKNVDNNTLTVNKRDGLIEEISTISFNENNNTQINDTIQINETLKIAIAQTKDTKLKKLLIHELRLNTLEMNLDCLTDLKCKEISKEQENYEQDLSLGELKKSVNGFDDLISDIEKRNLYIKNDMETVKSNILSVETQQVEMNSNLEKLHKIIENQEKLIERISIVEQHLEENNLGTEMMENVSKKNEKLSLTINALLEKLRENNPDDFELIDLV